VERWRSRGSFLSAVIDHEQHWKGQHFLHDARSHRNVLHHGDYAGDPTGDVPGHGKVSRSAAASGQGTRGFLGSRGLIRARIGILLAAAFGLPLANGQATSSTTPQPGPQSKPRNELAPVYRLVELPLRPTAISDTGWVAGSTADHTAARWSSRSGLEQIPLPPEFVLSEGTGINSEGEAVGVAFTADSSRSVAFVFRQGKTSLLPGEQSRAEGINDAGEVVGQCKPPGQKAVGAVRWKGNALLDLKICCAATARRINGSGQIVGDTYDPEGHYHAFVWDAEHASRLLSTAGEEYSSALALNQRGEVVVKAVPGGLFLYSGGKFEPIDAPQAAARGLNKDEVVVGSFGAKPEGQRAFVWDKAQGLRDLNGLIGANSGWKLEVATSINDRGEIVGWGDHGETENAGFLLVPLAAQKPSHK